MTVITVGSGLKITNKHISVFRVEGEGGNANLKQKAGTRHLC